MNDRFWPNPAVGARADLDAIFHEQLKHLFFSPSEITDFLHEGEEVMRQKEELLSHLETERGKIRREMDKLYDLYMSDQITKTGFGEKYHPLSERLEQVENQLPELQLVEEQHFLMG